MDVEVNNKAPRASPTSNRDRKSDSASAGSELERCLGDETTLRLGDLKRPSL